MSNLMCPKFEKAMAILSQRWVGLIIRQLMDGPMRFKDLEQSIGLSSKVLSDKLKYLEEEKIVIREVIPKTPVLITYSLTDKGKSLKPVIETIENWADETIKI